MKPVAAKSAAWLVPLFGVLLPLLFTGSAASDWGRGTGLARHHAAGLALGTVTAAAANAQAAQQITFRPHADAEVRAAAPRMNFGKRRTLRVDARPLVRSYIRFRVRGLSGPPSRAVLRLYTAGRSDRGVEARIAGRPSWNERRITFRSAPRPGALRGATGPVRQGWTSLDVSSAIRGNHTVTFVLTTRGVQALRIASRETGARAPRLIVNARPLPGLPPPGAPPIPSPPEDPTCPRPYATSSPWNAPIGSSPRYHPQSPYHVTALQGLLSSDPTQYTYPVYQVTSTTALQTVSISGWFSNVVEGGARLVNQRAGTIRLPIPSGAQAAAGSDAQMILVDPATGDEWGVSNLARTSTGDWSAWNAYHYNTGWTAVPPADSEGRPFFARGAGVPYLAGLVRPCEIARGRIDHALAFAYDFPTAQFVHPATKSDGDSSGPPDMPEGARLQLDPTISETEIQSWGCTGPCLTIAKALQAYGMYIIDNSGRPKVMMEYEATAGWNGLVNSRTPNPIPLNRFKLIDHTSAPPPSPPAPPPGPPGTDPVLAAAGDIAYGGSGDDQTAEVLDAVAPTVVVTMGDNAYESGSAEEFTSWYQPTWGRHKSKTRPSPGNHEYRTSGASGYFGYFGSAAGTPGKGWYSYDIGAWHLIALNTNGEGSCAIISCSVGSEQERWLRADLAATQASCVLAYFHHPRFSTGPHGDNAGVKPLWQALYDYNADVILQGHDHNYQRWAPMNPDGQLDPSRGIRSFVVGTGGKNLYSVGSRGGLEAKQGDTLGILKLILRTGSYDWEFEPVAGKTYNDSGTGSCH